MLQEWIMQRRWVHDWLQVYYVPAGLGCGVLFEDEIFPDAFGELEEDAKPVTVKENRGPNCEFGTLRSMVRSKCKGSLMVLFRVRR